MYKLKIVNNRVNALYRAGKDLVKTSIPASQAALTMDTGSITDSDIPGYPICVENKWYFEGEKIKTKKVIKDD